MRPWLAYSRVSRVGDRTETLVSPELQAARIEAYATARGLEVEMLPAELDVSGGKIERPILSEAIGRIEAGEAAGIIVAQLDRLSRMDITDALRTIRRIEDSGGQVIAVAENFDAGTPEGRLARNMFLSIGQLQLDRYKLAFAAAKRQAVERGIWPTNTAPIGYRVGPERKLVIVEADANRVRRAFELRSTGASWREVGRVIDRQHSGAFKVVTNRVYLGEVRLTIGGEGVVNLEAHEPIVSRDLFEAAQIDHPRPARRGNPPALLAGLVRCAACRGAMSPAPEMYRCMNRQAAADCRAPAIISRRLLDEHVVNVTLAAIEDVRFQAYERIGEAQAAEVAVTDAEAELAAFQRATEATGMDPAHFTSGLRSRAEAVEAARQRLARARLAAIPQVPGGDLRSLWPKLGVEDRRHLLGGALGVVWVAKGRGLGRVRIIAAGFEPSDLPRAGRTRGEVVAAPEGDLEGQLGVPHSEDVE